jgi:hypothetical protein
MRQMELMLAENLYGDALIRREFKEKAKNKNKKN